MAETRVCSTVSQNVLDLWAAKRTHQRAYIRLVTHRRPVAGKLVMGILALIAEFENDIRRERQMDGIAKAHERGVRFGRKRELTDEAITEIKALRDAGNTVPAIMREKGLSKSSVYRALSRAV